MSKYLGLFFCILLSGCASTTDQKTASNNNEDLVCEYIAKTGSNIKRRTCMTRELADELRKENEADMREAWRKGQTSAGTK
ncbi:hypothetical protein [Shewanella sp. UCD-KL21]|uniref:hypothetical protein n=1 Tax=Shewanella sp. UCD-KL21 TaxID=1917164 RepID=UPI001115AAB3|nr:hypothetical protein [Shewanella sp. UCD-KL21]